MTETTHENLVAVPFNAAAHNPALQRQVTDMMHEHHQAFSSGKAGGYYGLFLLKRFGAWPLERIEAEHQAFLAHETRHSLSVASPNSTRINIGHLIIDTTRDYIVGERCTGHFSHNPTTATGIDIIRPSERGQGLSYRFFELGCLVAKNLGYAAYEASIASNNPASYKRLDVMVQEERAVRLPDDWGEGVTATKRYRIDLKSFAAQTSANLSARFG